MNRPTAVAWATMAGTLSLLTKVQEVPGLFLLALFSVTLVLMFAVDFYQNWLERKRENEPVELRRRKR